MGAGTASVSIGLSTPLSSATQIPPPPPELTSTNKRFIQTHGTGQRLYCTVTYLPFVPRQRFSDVIRLAAVGQGCRTPPPPPPNGIFG